MCWIVRWTWTRLNRARRRLGFDHNDLRRRIDRLQWALATMLTVIFLVSAPPTAKVVADHVYHSGTRVERQEAATRHQVEATVVHDGQAGSAPGGTTQPATVRMRWAAPDGSPRVGDVPTRGISVTGARQHIWINDAGNATAPPRRHIKTISNAVYAAGGTVAAIALLLLVPYAVLRRYCDHRRYELWDSEWAHVDRGRTG